MSYQDKWTRWHDRSTNGEIPSSNNGWCYSAYSKYLAPKSTNKHELLKCFNLCLKSFDPLRVDRLPQKTYPVMSKDEIIGLCSLGLLTNHDLVKSHWNFCNLDYTPQKLTFSSVFKAVKALWKIRHYDRNYFWKNKITDTYALAFYLAPWDQYYVQKYYGYTPNLLQTLAFYINALVVILKGNKSVRMLLWLQLKDLNSKYLIKAINEKKWVFDYFDEGHPFRKGLK